jgi:hypothetical protein
LNLYLGIDPGIGGAWSVINSDLNIIAHRQGKDMEDEFLDWHPEGRIKLAYLENQSVRPSDFNGGRVYNIQKLLINFGIWQGILATLGIPFKLVHPWTWLARCGCSGRMSGKERKALYTQKAREIWPDRKFKAKDHDLAAALILAVMAKEDLSICG